MRDSIFGCIQASEERARMFTVTALKNDIRVLTSATQFVIAYSGGLDSHVLLHAMCALRADISGINIQAVHVNHQLNPLSTSWALHCKKICDALSIPFQSETIAVTLKPGDSLEEQARLARYAALKKYLDDKTVLLTAHNLNDQAETFLLQALRGAGPKGLSAMPVQKKIDDSVLIRPLLSFSRNELESYAHDNKLQWIEDDSNVDPRFRRNFLRHDIFPLLIKEFPGVMNNFSRSARLIAQNEKKVTEITRLDFEKLKTDDLKKINLVVLREFPMEQQKLLLREWFYQNQLRMPNEKHLTQILRDVVQAGPEAKPIFRLENSDIRRDRLFLYLTTTCCRIEPNEFERNRYVID